jgi:hypothetical protein
MEVGQMTYLMTPEGSPSQVQQYDPLVPDARL